MHTNTSTFCKYRKKLLASPRVHLVEIATKLKYAHIYGKVVYRMCEVSQTHYYYYTL